MVPSLAENLSTLVEFRYVNNDFSINFAISPKIYMAV